MKIDNLEIRTNPFKKSPVRKKDGLHQIKIRVFIGSYDYGKFRNKVTLEVTILDETNNPVLASSSDFENRKSNKSLNLIILKTEAKVKDSVAQMVKDNIKLTSTNLFNYLYKKRKSQKNETASDSEETIWNDEVKKFFDEPIPVSVWEKYKLAVIEDDTENITEEEMEDIADGVYFDHSRVKETKRVSSMSFNERYKTGNYDKSNIFELFGYCWSENPKNGESLVTGSYKSLVVQLNDYRFNAKPSESFRITNYRIAKSVGSDHRTVKKALKKFRDMKLIIPVTNRTITINLGEIIKLSEVNKEKENDNGNSPNSTIPDNSSITNSNLTANIPVEVPSNTSNSTPNIPVEVPNNNTNQQEIQEEKQKEDFSSSSTEDIQNEVSDYLKTPSKFFYGNNQITCTRFYEKYRVKDPKMSSIVWFEVVLYYHLLKMTNTKDVQELNQRLSKGGISLNLNDVSKTVHQIVSEKEVKDDCQLEINAVFDGSKNNQNNN